MGILVIALATVSLQTAPPAYVIYLYVLGSVNFFAAMLGCCGICREHFWMTATVRRMRFAFVTLRHINQNLFIDTIVHCHYIGLVGIANN